MLTKPSTAKVLICPRLVVTNDDYFVLTNNDELNLIYRKTNKNICPTMYCNIYEREQSQGRSAVTPSKPTAQLCQTAKAFLSE